MAKIKKELDEKIRLQAKSRCGYCLSPQELIPYKLEIDHIFPRALDSKTGKILERHQK